MFRSSLGVALAAISFAPFAAAASPKTFMITKTLLAGQQSSITVGPLAQGEFAFTLRAGLRPKAASGAPSARVRVRQQRIGGTAFPILNTTSRSSGCKGNATIVCTDITSPSTPAGQSWKFTILNSGAQRTDVKLTIRWRVVMNAG